MEGKEGGKGGMIPWWAGLICGVVGEIIGMMVIIICMGRGTDKAEAAEKERKRLQAYDTYAAREILRGMPPETMSFSVTSKKAADAGTSTAAHMGRKDYFL